MDLRFGLDSSPVLLSLVFSEEYPFIFLLCVVSVPPALVLRVSVRLPPRPSPAAVSFRPSLALPFRALVGGKG